MTQDIKQRITDYLALDAKEKRIRESFDHPCRGNCSGWRQGYEKGQFVYADFARKLLICIETLEKINENELNSQRPGGSYSAAARLSYEALEKIGREEK